jgi:hypothetical protein
LQKPVSRFYHEIIKEHDRLIDQNAGASAGVLLDATAGAVNPSLTVKPAIFPVPTVV